MALISCPECNRQVSDQAPNCIHCGFPLTKKVTSVARQQTTQVLVPMRVIPTVAFRQGFADGRKVAVSAPGTSPLPEVVVPRPVVAAPTALTPAPVSVADAVREGATQADYNKNAASLWGLQVLVVAGIAGFGSSSWIVFGVVFLLLAVLINIPFLGKLIGFAMAAAFGYGIYELGKHFGSPEAGAVIGAIVGLAFAVGNATVRQYGQDLNTGRKK